MRAKRGTRKWGRLGPEMRGLFGESEDEIIENFLAKVVWIRGKDGGSHRFILNPEQRRLHWTLSGDDLVVKPRQIGVTTYFTARQLAKAILWPNQRRVIAFHREDAATAARRDILGFMFSHIDPAIRPVVSHDNRMTLAFPEWHSSVEVIHLSAGVGRSGMVNGVHLSEAAYYKSSVAGLTESVPAGGEISVESTGDDPSGEFYAAVMAAFRGESRSMLHFFPWLEHKEYSVDGEDLGELDPTEIRLVKEYQAKPGQLRWRRRKINSMGFVDDPNRFPREYPVTVHEAFQFGGIWWFDQRLVEEREREITQSIVTVVEKRVAGWTFWEKPDPAKNYILAADVATGESTAASAAVLLNATDYTQAAEFHSKIIATDLFACELNDVGREFGFALLAPESNNVGHAVVSDLLHVHQYPNLYEHEPYHSNPRPGSGADPWKTRQWGWNTDVRTRPLIFNAIARELREKAVRLRSLPLLDEVRKTTRENGKPRPASGTTGDRVIALGIALALLEKLPAYSSGSLSSLQTATQSREDDRVGFAKGGTMRGILREEGL